MEASHLLGDGVDLIANLVTLFGQLALLGIEFDQTVQTRGILAPSGDGSLDGLGIST